MPTADTCLQGGNYHHARQDGNAFAILGQVRRGLKRAGNPPDVLAAFQAEATAGDYAHLLITCMEYADIS